MMVKVIKHKDINKTILDEIISIKNISWPHSYESQVRWIEENVKPDDLHFLVYDQNNILIGYLSLKQIEVILNSIPEEFLGIGAVCTLEKGQGYGKLLMENLSIWLTANNHKGMLFCKDRVVEFYEKYGWKMIEYTNFSFSQINNSEIRILIYNVLISSTLSYKGETF